jgi:hypothetical protein
MLQFVARSAAAKVNSSAPSSSFRCDKDKDEYRHPPPTAPFIAGLPDLSVVKDI